MGGRLRVMTVVGTRPEIIRLARVMAALDRHTEHYLVHTGQNYDRELNEIFFDDLELTPPTHYLNADTSSLGAVYGDVLRGTERAINEVRPDAVLVLGDTNSCIAALMARRMKVPAYHMEAGNRAFDPNVPEEINRHLVDHVADYNLVYTEHSRRNLLAEGLHPSRVVLTGSPMKEVLTHYAPKIAASAIVDDLGLREGEYFVASMHREENVDHPQRLESLLAALALVADTYGLPIVMSTHPRTRKRIELGQLEVPPSIMLHKPLGFTGYVRLQQRARCVLSDSGTISEESTILGFPAVTLRDAIERPEAVDVGGIVLTGTRPEDVLDSVRVALALHEGSGPSATPADYQIADVSRRVVAFIRSTATTHAARTGLRLPTA